jgi:hypothetical protein
MTIAAAGWASPADLVIRPTHRGRAEARSTGRVARDEAEKIAKVDEEDRPAWAHSTGASVGCFSLP